MTHFRHASPPLTVGEWRREQSGLALILDIRFKNFQRRSAHGAQKEPGGPDAETS
jgi:hypothetical protein